MEPDVFIGKTGGSVAVVIVFWSVFYLWLISELFLGWRLSRRKSGAVVDQDAGSKWVLISSIWLGVALGISVAAAVPNVAFRSDRLLLFIVGIVLALAGLALRWYSIWFLGQAFTCEVGTRPGQTVVDHGPYRWIRHPSYTGSLMTVLGLLICMANPLALIGVLVASGGYAYRIRVEERVLASELGDTYRRYMQRTKRLVPFVI